MAGKSRSGPPDATIRSLYRVGNNPKQPAKTHPAGPKNPPKAAGIRKGPAPKGGGKLY